MRLELREVRESSICAVLDFSLLRLPEFEPLASALPGELDVCMARSFPSVFIDLAVQERPDRCDIEEASPASLTFLPN
jgi:hypothetical protein